MAATSCEYERGSASAVLDQRGRATYTIRYRITTDTDTWPAEALNDVLVTGTNPGPRTPPPLWTAHGIQVADATSYLKGRTCDYLDGENSRQEFLVTDTYSPLESGEEPGQDNVDPTARPARWSVEREVYTHRIEFDKDGVAITNTAGQPFDIDPEIERTRSVLVARYNVATLDDVISLNLTYEDTVNSSVWKGIPSRGALCREVSAGELITEGSYAYYPITFRFSIHQEEPDRSDASAGTWDIGILQRGFSAFAVDNMGVKKNPEVLGRIMSDATVQGSDLPANVTQSTNPSVEPRKLADNGTVLAGGADAVFKYVRARQERDFNSITKLA